MNPTMLDDNLLLEYMNRFYGYGNLQSTCWFIGMEEGSSGTVQEIIHRLHHWQKRGKMSVEDVALYHQQFGIDRFFGTNARLQPTWNKLIRIYLSLQGQKPTTEMVRQFQVRSFGRHSSDNCILELLPLPSKSITTWIYANHSQIPELQTRDSYHNLWMPKRAHILRELILQYKPHCVIFYSVNPIYQHWWKQIANIADQWSHREGVQVATNTNTTFAITKHPVTKGISSEYFHSIGRIIREYHSWLTGIMDSPQEDISHTPERSTQTQIDDNYKSPV